MSALSYSNYSLLRTCGYKYKLKLVDGLQEPKAVAFEFGSAMHAGLRCVLETREVESAQDVFGAYWNSSQKDLDYAGERFKKEDLESMGNKFIANFFKKYGKEMSLITGENRLYAGSFEGTPDALVKWGGSNVLLDYKTSAYNYANEKTDVSLQLNLYAYLLEENGFKVDKLCYMVFCKGAGSIQTPVLVDYDRKKALTMLNEMVLYFKRNGGFFEKNPNACVMGKQVCAFYGKCWKNE